MSKMTFQEATAYTVDLSQARDENHPRSLVNIVPGYMRNGILAIPDELFEMSLEDIEKMGKITRDDELMRINFWFEYNRAQSSKTDISASNIWRGVTHFKAFSRLCQNSFKLLYLITPEVTHETDLNYLLKLATRRSEEILRLPIVDPSTGKVNEKLVATIAKMLESYQNRLHGAPVVRSMQMNVNRNYNGNGPNREDEPLKEVNTSAISLEDIQSQIEELDRVMGLKDTSPPKAVTDGSEREVIDIEAVFEDDKIKR